MTERIWTTGDEIRFFKKASPTGMPRHQFLLNYKEAIRHRTNWGIIDKNEVLKKLNQEIKLLKGD